MRSIEEYEAKRPPRRTRSPQTRRSISVTREFYATLKAYCEKHDLSMSGLVEKVCADHLAVKEMATLPVPIFSVKV